MKTEYPERENFNEMLNKSKCVVADEIMFTATHNFFDNMSKDQIMIWVDTCMDFVYIYIVLLTNLSLFYLYLIENLVL